MPPARSTAMLARIATALAGVALAPCSAFAEPPPPPHHHEAPPPHHPPSHGPKVVVINRSAPHWWVGQSAFVAYTGPRVGFYFAPGYGYYRVPAGYYGRPFVVGVVLPPAMRGYRVVSPALYGLAPPPAGCDWFFAASGFVLVSKSQWTIVRSVSGGW